MGLILSTWGIGESVLVTRLIFSSLPLLATSSHHRASKPPAVHYTLTPINCSLAVQSPNTLLWLHARLLFSGCIMSSVA
jgi:hypothetical protein